jgi:hypothetical protein
VRSISNTFVNAIINVSGGVVSGGFTEGVLTAVRVLAPPLAIPAVVIGGLTVAATVVGGNEIQDFLTKDGTIRGQYIQQIKYSMSNTIKNTYNLAKRGK